jgi:hypothetical protein
MRKSPEKTTYMKFCKKRTFQIVALAAISVYVGARTYSASHRRQNTSSSQLLHSSQRYAAIYISDTSGHQLESLFDGIPVDPHYSKYKNPPKVTTCQVRSGVQRASSLLRRGLELLGLSFDNPVYAQNICFDCGKSPAYSNCATPCGGQYWGGPTEPSGSVFTGFNWIQDACPGNPVQCNIPEPRTYACSCQEGDLPL